MTDPRTVELGRRLRIARHNQGWSLDQAAVWAEALTHLPNFKASTLGAYERGARVVNVPTLHDLADLYRVPVAWLLGVDTDRQPVVTADHLDLIDATQNFIAAITEGTSA